MMVRVDGVFLADETGKLRHVSRQVVGELGAPELAGPWRLELRSAINKPLAALAAMQCSLLVPRDSGVYEAAPAGRDEDDEFDGTFFVVRGRIVVELPAGGAPRARHEA